MALGAVTALILATGAFGFDSGGTPAATGADTITWTGQGANKGVLNTEQCDAANDPLGAGVPYLLWVFTTDGGSAENATLHLGTSAGANDLGDFAADTTQGSNFHFVTPYYTPDTSTLFAYADFTVDSTGNGSWNLVISHGCSGSGRTPADNPTVSKDASGSYDNTIGWTIDKSANTDTVYSAGGGESGPVDYTITVTHDSGTPSNVEVTGTITASNPSTNTGSVTLDSVSDEIVDGSTPANHLFDCTVSGTSGAGALTIAAGGTKQYSYSCDLGDTPPTGDVFNHVTIAWSGQNVGTTQHLNAGSADFTTPAINFTANPIDNCVQVTDTLDGTPTLLGMACANTGVFTKDAGNTLTDFASSYDGTTSTFTLTYSRAFTGDPAGTCTAHENQASVGTVPPAGGLSVELTTPTDPVSVQDCQGADLTVSKTASGTYDRECSWTIDKTVVGDSTKTGDAGQQTSFGYEVTLGASCDTVKNVKVTGTITVSNPNDWEDITLTTLTDALDSSGDCTVDPGPYVVPASDSITVGYTCNNATLDDTLNTATATWDKDTYHTPTGSASGHADVSFTPTLIDDCVDVSDNYKGALGHFCTDADGNITGSNGAVNPIDYNLSFTGPAAGTCKDFTNTASATDNSTPPVTVMDSATVHLCSFGPRFTPGYWKNHLADSASGHTYSDSSCGSTALKNAGGSCSTQGPFAKQWANSSQWKCLGGVDKCSGVVTASGYTGFKVDTILKAAQVFGAMSCSFSGNAANQNQQAIGCLAGKLLAAKYNININGSNTCIAPVIALADSFLSPGHSVSYGGYTAQSITYTGPSGTYTGITSTGTTNNQRQVAIALQNALDAYDNGGGCH